MFCITLFENIQNENAATSALFRPPFDSSDPLIYVSAFIIPFSHETLKPSAVKT